VQGGGTVTMGSNITGVPTVFLQNAGTSYNFVANATAGLAIHASTDSDTITVGSASQKVFGSSGNLLVLATAANAGAAVEGSSTGSSNVLDITTNGTIALNSADDYLTVQLGAANTTLSLDHMKFIQAEGNGGSDTIIAGAAGQILTGGGGNDTLEDAGHYGVTFQDTAAGFSSDTIMDFTKVDKIDITGFSPPSGPPIYTGTYGASGSGVLAVTNGTGTVDIHMSALTAGGTFQAVSDLNGGTLITYS
jgi:Ca2+-binding RTX toxin-like protein